MSEQLPWVCIYKTTQRFEAEAIRGNLENEGIPCVVLNKQDSSYLSFGYVEVHVPENRKQEAEEKLKASTFNSLNEEDGV
jgi:hypothetical protein